MNIPAHIRRRLVKVLSRVEDPEAVALVEALGPRRREVKALEFPGKSKAERDEIAGALYQQAKRDAWERSRGRCEYADATGNRCPLDGNDPDHVVGGAHRKDCEKLGAEGLIIACRAHHDMKHANSPSRRYWLDQGKVHAIRVGSRRLLAIVDRAITRDESKRHRIAHVEEARR